jgi:hypothetical protein
MDIYDSLGIKLLICYVGILVFDNNLSE